MLLLGLYGSGRIIKAAIYAALSEWMASLGWPEKLLNILNLFAHLFNQHFKFNGNLRHFLVG